IWELKPQPFPEELLGANARPQGQMILSAREIRGRGAQVRVNRASGAVYVLGEKRPDLQTPALREQEYIDRARQLIEGLRLSEQNMNLRKSSHFLIASHPVEARPGTRQTIFQKNVVVVFKQQIMVGGKPVNV